MYIPGFSDVHDDAKGDDLALLRESRTSMIHCPIIYGRGGEALESFGSYKRAGVNIAMGTDTSPPDMVQNILMGSSMAKHVQKSIDDCQLADFSERRH